MGKKKDYTFKSQGILLDLSKYILRRSDTNPSFAETCATVALSTAIGPTVVVATPKGDVYLNIDSIVIGGSSISNKTVAIKILRQIIKDFGEELGRDLLYPPKFSIEGLSKLFLERYEGAIVGDEFTAMFKGTAKTWLKDILEFLSNLYDNYVDDYITIKRGLERVDFVYANFVSATTFYLLKQMKDDDFFLQGTGVRILWDLDTERDELILTPIEAASFFMDSTERQDRDKELLAFVAELTKIHNVTQQMADSSLDNLIVLNFDIEAAKLLGMYRVKKLNEAIGIFNKDLLDPDAGFLARLTENAIKLAGIHCISRHFTNADFSLELPEINGEDVEWAIQKAEYHYQMYLKMKEIRNKIQSDFTTRGHKTDFERVLWIIEKNSGRANITKIMQGTHWLRDDAVKILQAMIDSDHIDIVEVDPPGSKKHGVYIKKGSVIGWVEKHRVRDNR